MSDLLTQINNAAHTGAFGHNPRSEPTLAQLAAGNYKKGVVMVKGLSIAIENPAYTYRKGMDKTGQQWMCLMQAHYGYIQGYKGNDGDDMDVFIGVAPENDTVYIVNQKTADGYFDEHKIMLGFLSQQQAVDTYQHCFERGWTGLMSVVPCTMTQFKWWLANGDKSRPVTLDRLPYAGLERLDSVSWGGTDDANLYSHGGQVHKLLYQIRQCDDTHQALEPLAYHDMIAELGNQGFMYENYDALIVEYNKLEKKAKQLLMVMQGAVSTVKPVGVTVSKPLTKGGVANVVAWFEMDDGQAVGVFFHNPDKTPKKIDPTDEMISYKWVLNKKDITIAVAPEQGKDLIIRTVAKRIMQLVEKNHDRFIKANGDKAALNQAEQDLTAQVAEKQAVLKGLQDEVAALQAKKVEKDAFTLQAQTEADLRQREAEAKAAEAERLAQEKAAQDKAQADKDASDFRLTGSNLPADVAAAGGQQDLLAGDGKGQQAPPTNGENNEIERIASLYAAALGHPVSKRSREFASDILSKNAYGLEFIANGMNDKGKKVFSEVTGVSLPKQQGATWKAIRDWAGVSDEQENYRIAVRDVAYETKAFMRENNVSQEMADKNKALIASKIAEGFDNVEKIGNSYWFTNNAGQGINLSEKPKKGYLGLSKSRALVEAMLVENKAKKLLDASAIQSQESIQQEPVTLTGKELGDVPTPPQDRPSNWRTNLANARAVAKSLGIETKGKKLERLIKDVDIFDDNEVKKELLAEFKGLASRLVLPKGYIFDLSDAEKSIGDITRSTAAWIRKQGKIDTNTIRIELRTIPDSSQGIIFNSVHIYTDDPKTKKEFDKFNYQRFGDIGASSPETPKEIIAKMELFLTKSIFPAIEAQKVKNSTTLDTVDLPSLGVANIESIGNENIYIEKDGKYYISKVGNTEDYALGEWDFAKYPEGKPATVAPVTQPEPTPVNRFGELSSLLSSDGWTLTGIEPKEDGDILATKPFSTERKGQKINATFSLRYKSSGNYFQGYVDEIGDTNNHKSAIESSLMLVDDAEGKVKAISENLAMFAIRNSAKKEPVQPASEPPMTNPDRDYLQSIIDGKDMGLAPKEITAKMRTIITVAREAKDTVMMDLGDQAAKAYAAQTKAKAVAKLAEVQ